MKTLFQKSGIFTGIVAFIFLTQSCTAQEKIPAHWLTDMNLTMSYGGGMRNYSYSIEFDSSGGSMVVNDEGKVIKYKLILSPAQLDEILAFLVQHNFSRIESEENGITYDKGTDDIMMSWGGRSIGASEGATTRIKERYRSDFFEVKKYLFQLAEKVRKME